MMGHPPSTSQPEFRSPTFVYYLEGSVAQNGRPIVLEDQDKVALNYGGYLESQVDQANMPLCLKQPIIISKLPTVSGEQLAEIHPRPQVAHNHRPLAFPAKLDRCFPE